MSIWRKRTEGRAAVTAPMTRAERRSAGLRLAAEAAASSGPDAGAAALEAAGLADAFDGPDDLARCAQRRWWVGLLGRLDGAFGEDLLLVPVADRHAAVRRAWADHLAHAGGLWTLALSAPGGDGVTDGLRGSARLLALYAGLAGPGDEPAMAAAVGVHLVQEVSGVAMHDHLPEAFVDPADLLSPERSRTA